MISIKMSEPDVTQMCAKNPPTKTLTKIREEVERVVSSEENNEVKIDRLKQVENEQYKSLIHQLAYKETLEELKDLVIVLKDLGYLTTKLGELSGELKCYTEAAIFYQYVITILEVDKKLNDESFIKQELTNSYEQLTNIQQLMFLTVGSNQEKMPVVQKEATSNKELLLALRKKTDREMQEIESYYQKSRTGNQEEKQKFQELYVNAARELFKKTADEMKNFLSKLYKTAEADLGKPPCKYAVIGLGSMALNQITPYSDLEFAILIENEDYKHSLDTKVREYFMNLSHLANFKMINLGESIIPFSKYDLDMSHLVHVAVNFDLGGKTPLGRMGCDKPYELIKTVHWMLRYVRNEEDEASHIDKSLPYILENVCYVYGDKELVKTYEGKVTEFLHSEIEDNEHGKLKNCEIRAIKLLVEGAVEFAYLKKVPDLKPEKKTFKGDLDKLEPNLSGNQGRLFEVKQEIYRLPDRMVYNLGLYYGIEGDSAWDTVDKLESKGILNSQAAFNLKNAITFATTLRLKTYSHHKAQKDDMSIFVRPTETESEIKEQTKQIFYLSEEDLGEQGGLFQYFYTALALHERLNKFCEQHQTLDDANKQTFFKESNFYKDDYASKGLIYIRLAQYNAARKNLELSLDNLEDEDNLLIRNALGIIYKNFGNSDQAIKQFQHCLRYGKKSPLVVASLLGNLSTAYKSKGDYDQAIIYSEITLTIRKLFYRDNPHSDVASSLNNLGGAYYAIREYDQAIKYHAQSLKMNKLIYDKDDHPNIAGSLHNLGSDYHAKGQYDQAIYFYQESLKMRKRIYKNAPHQSVAMSLNNLGAAYDDKGDYDQAINYLEECLKMNKLIHKKKPHPNIAGSLYNLGAAYDARGDYDQAIIYHEKSLKMRKLIYQDNPHSDVASSLNDLGEAYQAKGQYDQAIKYHEENLKMNKLIHKEKPHPNIAGSLNSLGNVYHAKGQYDQAIYYYQDCLKMQELIYKNAPNQSVAMSLNKLGNVYHDKGKYDLAIIYHEKSLKMKKLVYQDNPHSNVVYSLNDLGGAYKAKGQYDLAIKYHEESLKMNKLIHKGKPHPDDAALLTNLGGAHTAKGQYDLAIKYNEESLKMYKLIYDEQIHPNIAASLTSQGNAYHAKGQYDLAMDYFEDSLKMQKLIYQDNPHPDVAASLSKLGEAHAAKGQYDLAIKYFEDSLTMKKLIYQDKPHSDVATSLNNLGEAYAAKGQNDQAIKYYEDSLEIRKIIYKDDPHPSVAKSLNNLGQAYKAKEEYKQALDHSSQALQIISVFPNHPYQNIIQNSMEEVAVLINLSATTTSTSSNDLDVILLGDDSSATNQNLPPEP